LLGHKPTSATIGGHFPAEFFTLTNCAATARTPDEQQLFDVAAILAAGI
jgi:hypothetical protein